MFVRSVSQQRKPNTFRLGNELSYSWSSRARTILLLFDGGATTRRSMERKKGQCSCTERESESKLYSSRGSGRVLAGGGAVEAAAQFLALRSNRSDAK